MFRRKPEPVPEPHYPQPGSDSTWTELRYWHPSAVLVSGEVRGAFCTKCRSEICGLTWSVSNGRVWVLNQRLCATCEGMK